MTRGWLRAILSAGLLLGSASIVRAQDSLNAYGTYPSGIITGSPAPYGLYASGYYTTNSGYPFAYTTQVSPYYGSNYLAPSTTVYSSGYRGYTSPGYTPSYGYRGYAPYSYSYSYPNYGTYYAAPSYSYGRALPYSGYRWRRW